MKKASFLAFIFLLFPAFTFAATSTEKVSLPLPFLWEIPDGAWIPPWSGACEEAAILSVEGYYLKQPRSLLSKAVVKKEMLPIFAIENKIFGYNSDTDGAENVRLINDYTSYDAKLVDNPTLENIKDELRAGRPVISLHYGYDLKNPRHRFRRGGSSYHVMAITGFDDETSEFTANDSELPDGIDFRYKYDIIMNTLHDFSHITKKADGPARVIFTMPKTIVKTIGSGRVYLVRNNVKYHITNIAAFNNHRLNWNLVKIIDKQTLDAMETGKAINN